MQNSETSSESIIISGLNIGGLNEVNAIRAIYERHKDLLLSISDTKENLRNIVEIFVLGVKDGIFSYNGTISVANYLIQIAEYLKDPDSPIVNKSIQNAFENKILWEYYTTLFYQLSEKEREILLKNYADNLPIEELAAHQVATGQFKHIDDVKKLKEDAIQKLQSYL